MTQVIKKPAARGKKVIKKLKANDLLKILDQVCQFQNLNKKYLIPNLGVQSSTQLGYRIVNTNNTQDTI